MTYPGSAGTSDRDDDEAVETAETSYPVDPPDPPGHPSGGHGHTPRRTPPEHFGRRADQEAPTAATPLVDDSSTDPTEPDDEEQQLRARLARRGVARSTRVLAVLVGVVVILGLGALLGRATAPAGGPTSAAPAIGAIEGVDLVDGYPVLTIRAGDGSVTTLRTSAGTIVAVPRAGGPASLATGQQVTVTSERGTDGALTATRVDIPG